MSQHIVGIVIAVLGVLLTTAAVLWRGHQWNQRKPSIFYMESVGVIYKQGAVPWNDVSSALLDILSGMAAIKLAMRVEEALDFWIEVVPYEGTVVTNTVTTGFIKGNRNVSPPVTTEAAKDVIKVTGSFKTDRFLPTTKKQFIIVLRQTRQGDNRLTDCLAQGTGVTRTAVQSALFHEFAQHLVPFRLHNDLNASHARTDMNELEAAIKAASKRRAT